MRVSPLNSPECAGKVKLALYDKFYELFKFTGFFYLDKFIIYCIDNL